MVSTILSGKKTSCSSSSPSASTISSHIKASFLGHWYWISPDLETFYVSIIQDAKEIPEFKLGFNGQHTSTVAHSFVLYNVVMLQRFEDFNFPFKVSQVLFSTVLELLHSHHLPSVVLQRVIPAHLHTAKITLHNTLH